MAKKGSRTVKMTTGIIRTRKSTYKRGGPKTIIGKPSKKGMGKFKVEYSNTWYNRARRLNKHIR